MPVKKDRDEWSGDIHTRVDGDVLEHAHTHAREDQGRYLWHWVTEAIEEKLEREGFYIGSE